MKQTRALWRVDQVVSIFTAIACDFVQSKECAVLSAGHGPDFSGIIAEIDNSCTLAFARIMYILRHAILNHFYNLFDLFLADLSISEYFYVQNWNAEE